MPDLVGKEIVMTEDFQLHPLLEKDSLAVAHWGLSEIRLMNDKRYPWLLLIPRRTDLRDLHDPEEEDYELLSSEIRKASRLLHRETQANKMNVASLGNMVPQLHVHVIARFEEDAAWPGPVWGIGNPEPYTEDEISAKVRRYKELFEG